MKTKVVYYASGENAGTYDPKCFLVSFNGDLTETVKRFIHWDFDQLITVPLYEVREVDVPTWMDEKTWMKEHISIKYLAGISGLDVVNMPELWFRKLSVIGETYQYLIGYILRKNSKSAFHNSIREQITNWLDTPEPAHKTPLSTKQYEAISKFCPLYKAKQISTRLYWNR